METNKKKMKLDTLMLWCLSQNGVEEEKIDSCDAVYSLNNEKYGFIIEFGCTREKLLKAIDDSIPYLNYIYIFTDDTSKKQELLKFLPNKIGILSDCNDYNLGTMIGIQKHAIKL